MCYQHVSPPQGAVHGHLALLLQLWSFDSERKQILNYFSSSDSCPVFGFGIQSAKSTTSSVDFHVFMLGFLLRLLLMFQDAANPAEMSTKAHR